MLNHLGKRNTHLLRPMKDDLGLKILGKHCNPCECSKVYVRQTGHTTETSCKDHAQHSCLHQPDKTAMAKHSNDKATVSVSRTPLHWPEQWLTWMTWWKRPLRSSYILTTSTEIWFSLSQSWSPTTDLLQQWGAIKQEWMEGSVTASSPNCRG